MKRLLTAVSLVLCAFSGYSKNYPQQYFQAPMDTPLVLSGTFGELRKSHFHSGIDFSTNYQEGLSVKAAAEGYVSRIKISATGFGNTLYITHPNGYVTVYAHLKKFRDDLQAYAHLEQNQKKSFEIDINPKKNELKVVQGEEIALSGNSGSSEAPHLHFEIRDERSEEPINPLLFGLPISDHQKPILRALRLYPKMQSGIVEQTDTARTFEIVPIDTLYNVTTFDYIKVYGIVGLGFDVIDQQDGSDATLGIYHATLSVDGIQAYEWINDRLNFDDTRYANAHMDYQVYKRDGNHVERCYRMDGNHLTNIYPDTSLTGLLNFTDDESHQVIFIASDYAGNSCSITFQLQSYTGLANKLYQQYPETALLLSPETGIAIHKNSLDVVVPPGAVYEEFYYTDDEIGSDKQLSSTFIVGDRYEALHKPFNLSIRPNKPIVDSLKSKALIARVELDGKIYAQGGTWSKEFLTAKPQEFGNFIIMLDTMAPTVRHEYYPADLNTSRGAIVQVIVEDDLSGLSNYSISIDGAWRLAEYDLKGKMLTADLAGIPLNNLHKLEVTVTDERGNKRIWTDEFWW